MILGISSMPVKVGNRISHMIDFLRPQRQSRASLRMCSTSDTKRLDGITTFYSIRFSASRS
jgi:hypothetical protein